MIDASQLLSLLPEQRWYAGRGEELDAIAVIDWAVIEDGRSPLIAAVVEATYKGGKHDRYHLLLILNDGTVQDAFQDADRLRAVGWAMAKHVSLKGSRGVFHFSGAGLDPSAALGNKSIRAIESEQSNSSVILDDQVIVKFFRRPDVGPNPDLQLNRWLTNEGFEHVPAQVGEFIYEQELSLEEDGGKLTMDLALAQQWVDGTDGWQEVLVHLDRLYREADPLDSVDDIPFLVEQRSRRVLDDLEQLGDVTGALHVALSREESDPDLAPETVTRSDLEAWADRVQASLQELPTEGMVQVEPRVQGIEGLIGELREIKEAGSKTRVHGDYHLGQVMFSTRGWMIIDFEGEPLRSLEARRAKQSPLRDVAGMLRSLNYAASAALFERAEPDSDEWRRLQPWAQAWEELARRRFVVGYVRKSHEGRFLPPDREARNVMLRVFELDKALYELRYEASHRPQWLRIPLRGISQIVEAGQNG